jgi:ABC-2 type transport system ATP-binding protein
VNPATSTIEVQDVRKRYGGTVAVAGVSFEVEDGEFFGILGPNGAGKTTTLEIVEGLRVPDSGHVRILGLEPQRRNPSLLPRIGVQLQASAFFDRLTAREQIRTFASLYRIDKRAADEMLERFGLTAQAGTLTERLSGGQARRLSLACVLVHDPEVIFLDEPTAGLDPQARRNLWDLLRDVNARGRTIVLTTHYLEEAEALCDRVAIMDGGRILRCGPPDSLVRALNGTTRVAIQAGVLAFDDAQKMFPDDTVTADDSSLVITTLQPAGVLHTLAAGNALHGLTVRGSTLEDVFLELTGREYRP